MRRLVMLLTCALVAAAGVTLLGDREPFTQSLVKAEAADALPQYRDALRTEPAAVNAVFLDYADDQTLLLNARLALIRYPHMTREILPLYGTEPEFRAVFSRYGPTALPPIHYFLHHEVRTLRLMRAAGEAITGAKQAVLSLWRDGSASAEHSQDTSSGTIAPIQRGWYAVNFIQNEGHDFLGQFVVSRDGDVKWIQTERALEGTTAFFTSGIRT
ncbi:MAG TPA: hypothetical protein VKA32_03715, partial [Gammaproteobacteria bacterium]|nr:hypothetical protein [Gammaproteobacteria bacterium]